MSVVTVIHIHLADSSLGPLPDHFGLSDAQGGRVHSLVGGGSTRWARFDELRFIMKALLP